MTRPTRRLWLVPVVLLASALTSCDSAGPSGAGPAVGAPANAAVDGLSARFGGFSQGERFRKSNAEDAFGPDVEWTNSNDDPAGGPRLQVYDGHLRFRIPTGKYGNDTGGKMRAPLRPRSGYYLQYRLRFDSGFDFSAVNGKNGGKLPGLAGGEGNTGNDPGTDGDGWSARMMWRGDKTSDTGSARLYAYLYHKDQEHDYGDYIDTGVDVRAGNWYTVRIYTGVNTDDNKDGRLKVWIKEDSERPTFGSSVVSRSNMRWMDHDHEVSEALVQVFAGGGDLSWALGTTSYVRLDDIFTCHTAAECDGLL